MNALVYAVIAYVRSPVGIFVEELRRELHPAHTHADAHVTILPPRPLCGSQTEAAGMLTLVAGSTSRFEVTMGEVESFVPITPTVFLRVARGAYLLRELRDKLNRDTLCFQDAWPYMPHLTIAKMGTAPEADKVLAVARQRWQSYAGPRTVAVDALTLVKGCGDRWVDVFQAPLADATGH